MAEKKAKKTTKKTVTAAAETKPAPATSKTSMLAGRKGNLRGPIASSVAEMIGTFMLAAVVIATQGQPLYVMFALIAIVLVTGQLSGAHLNPAITFGAWVARQVTGLRAIGYVVAQFVGAMLAVIILTALLDKTPVADQFTGAAQTPSLFTAADLKAGREWIAFFAEVLGATILAFGVASAMRQTERLAGAFTVGASLMVGLMIGGATVVLNPAVALAIKALEPTQLTTVGVFAIATLIGGGIGFLLHKFLWKEVSRAARS